MDQIATGNAGKRLSRAKAMGIRSPLKAIRAKCVDCCCGQVREIRDCRIMSCALWPYRMGRYPKVAET